MGWKIYFWAIAALLVVPLPFKLAGYFSGKDASPIGGSSSRWKSGESGAAP